MFYICICFSLYLLNYFDAEGTLQWPQTYHFKATLKIPSANLVEPYEVWSSGYNGHHRFDFYQGMPKMYQKRRGLVNNVPQFQYYWLRPESTSMNQNRTICYQMKNTSREVKLLYHYLPPMYNFGFKGHDVNQTTKWEYSYTGQKYGAVYVYALWTTGSTTDWVPVRYEYKMFYKGVERDFIQHIYEKFNRIRPNADIYRIPHDLRCKPISDVFEDELEGNPDYMKPILQYNMTELFERFKFTHKKQYKTNEEYFTRFIVFLKNYRYIQSVNRQQSSFKLAVNRFTDLTDHELSKLRNGTKIDQELLQLNPNIQDNDEDIEDDKDFDWRWYDAVSPVKDQTFLCGSCYAFAAAAVVESAAYISKGCMDMIEVSEQAIIDCSRGPNGTGNQGCNGGYLYTSFKWIKKNGIPLKKDYGPYLAMDGYCKIKQPRHLYISNYTRILNNTIKSIKDALQRHGPLAALIHVPDSLFYHISGIYDDKTCSSTTGEQTHAVVIIGYGIENGRRYWLIKNSWGTQWSDKGYFKLDLENNLCGVRNVVYAVVHPQSQVKECKKMEP